MAKATKRRETVARRKRTLFCAALLSPILAGCGGAGEWTDYVKSNDLVERNFSGYPADGALADVTRTGARMCRLLRDEDFSQELVVIAFMESNPGADPEYLEALTWGADRYLCDNVDYNDSRFD